MALHKKKSQEADNTPQKLLRTQTTMHEEKARKESQKMQRTILNNSRKNYLTSSIDTYLPSLKPSK